MQEDKTSKWFASMLRKQQEESPLPYELGAWEAFEKRQAAIARKKTAYWISGIAASLALLLVVGGVWLSSDLDSKNPKPSEQLALEERGVTSSSEKPEIEVLDASEGETLGNPEVGKTPLPEVNSTKENTPKNAEPSKDLKPVDQKVQSTIAEAIVSATKEESPSKEQKLEVKSSLNTDIQENKQADIITNPTLQQSLIANQEKSKKENEIENTVALEEKVVLKEELPTEPQLTAEEIEEILETPTSFARLVLGLSPGYGASQGTMNATSGSSLGFGVMVDKNIIGKMAIGSGLAVNYLNQASESQNYIMGANFASPVTAKNEIAQVQVDIPIFVRYPVNQSQSISVQAGFSNLITFNQNAEQNSSYTRQIAVLDANSAMTNSFTLRSESVSQSASLDVPGNGFYPFATANLGVILRLFESKKTSYEVMPFYNYPLQDFSGYGEKLGIFGASFKVNFGTIQRK